MKLIQPVDPAQPLGLAQALSYPALLAAIETPSETKVLAVGGALHPTVEVTRFVSPTIVQLLSSGGFGWLPPVESSERVREQAGGPTGEIWRYDLEARAWQHVLRFTSFPPREVLAAGYDYPVRRLIVLDQLGIEDFAGGVPGTPASSSSAKAGKAAAPTPAQTELRRVRLVLHDLDTETSVLLGAWKRTDRFDRFALMARDDGSFVLLASQTMPELTAAYSARLEGKLIWTGHTVLHGRMVFQPRTMERGLIVPLINKGAIDIVELGDADFHPPVEILDAL